MARRVVDVTITEEGRDKGKRFRLTEMPASQAERWAMRALLAFAKAGVPMPDDMRGAGFAAVAAMGYESLALLDFEDVAPLLDEMMRCVQVQPDPNNRDVVRDLIEDDIEEVRTRMRLRKEVLELHLGFSMAAELSRASAATTGAG